MVSWRYGVNSSPIRSTIVPRAVEAFSLTIEIPALIKVQSFVERTCMCGVNIWTEACSLKFVILAHAWDCTLGTESSRHAISAGMTF